MEVVTNYWGMDCNCLIFSKTKVINQKIKAYQKYLLGILMFQLKKLNKY